MSTLSKQEIHQLAMQEVGDYLEKEGFEFLAVNSQLHRSPQFVCVKDRKLYFVQVNGYLYPDSPKEYDVNRMKKVKEHALKNKAILYRAGVGFANAENYNLPLKKNHPYAINFSGLEKM